MDRRRFKLQSKGDLATFLGKTRLERGMYQRDFGELIGRKQQDVSRWETCENSPALEELIEIADILGFELELVEK